MIEIKDILKVNGSDYPSVLISGARYSGKSYLTKQIIKSIRREWDYIYIIKGSPDKSLCSLEKYDNVLCIDFDIDTVDKLLKTLEAEAKGKEQNKTLLVFDDCMSHFSNSRKGNPIV